VSVFISKFLVIAVYTFIYIYNMMFKGEENIEQYIY